MAVWEGTELLPGWPTLTKTGAQRHATTVCHTTQLRRDAGKEHLPKRQTRDEASEGGDAPVTTGRSHLEEVALGVVCLAWARVGGVERREVVAKHVGRLVVGVDLRLVDTERHTCCLVMQYSPLH